MQYFHGILYESVNKLFPNEQLGKASSRARQGLASGQLGKCDWDTGRNGLVPAVGTAGALRSEEEKASSWDSREGPQERTRF